VVVVLAGACASRESGVPAGAGQPDKFLFDRGTEGLKDEKWITSREFFRQLIDSYPQSPYRADAKLGLGDSYVGEGTTEAYVLAISEFREFLTFFPTHPRADYAQYRIALVHFNHMRAPERDQSETKDAIEQFELFVQRYPNSPLMPEAQAKFREARDRLSESEYRVGLFYYRSRWYPGAIDRFKAILKSDPQYTGRDAVYFYLAESLYRNNLKPEALPYYERLVKEFDQSVYLEESRKRIAELKTGEDQHAF
jgi:outer membrane protein assembly factor BamD